MFLKLISFIHFTCNMMQKLFCSLMIFIYTFSPPNEGSNTLPVQIILHSCIDEDGCKNGEMSEEGSGTTIDINNSEDVGQNNTTKAFDFFKKLARKTKPSPAKRPAFPPFVTDDFGFINCDDEDDCDVKLKKTTESAKVSFGMRMDPCELDKDAGSSCQNIAGTQYYYNYKSKRCESFSYRGCDGNMNRWPTMQECREFCEDSKTPDVSDTKSNPQPSGVATKNNGLFSSSDSQGNRNIRGPVLKFTKRTQLKSTDLNEQKQEAGKQSDLRAAANVIVNNGLFACLLLLLINVL